jgi:hypothetical protein
MNTRLAMAAEKPNYRRELGQMQAEPLLPIERKLVGWSLGLGAVLLVLLVWMTWAFFPAH